MKILCVSVVQKSNSDLFLRSPVVFNAVTDYTGGITVYVVSVCSSYYTKWKSLLMFYSTNPYYSYRYYLHCGNLGSYQAFIFPCCFFPPYQRMGKPEKLT